MVEFVSANPTGPMHMGNARGGVLGDTLASVLTACGADVTREFYVNDAGHQIDKFAHSIEARYLQLIQGEDAVPFPEDGYQGEDIRDLARAYYDQNGDKLLNAPEAGAAGHPGPVRPLRQPAQDEERPGAVQDPLRQLVL